MNPYHRKLNINKATGGNRYLQRLARLTQLRVECLDVCPLLILCPANRAQEMQHSSLNAREVLSLINL